MKTKLPRKSMCVLCGDTERIGGYGPYNMLCNPCIGELTGADDDECEDEENV